jgi:hypothetical protein
MVDDFPSGGAEEQPCGSSAAKAQKRGRFLMKGSGSLTLADYGGDSCLQILSSNGSALGSWPLRTAGEEYRHGEPGGDVLLNIEIWNENLGRCLGSCQGALALLGLRENRGKATPLQNRVVDMNKAVLQFTNNAGVLPSARGGTRGGAAIFVAVRISSKLEFGVDLGAVFETTHGSYPKATGNSTFDELYVSAGSPMIDGGFFKVRPESSRDLYTCEIAANVIKGALNLIKASGTKAGRSCMRVMAPIRLFLFSLHLSLFVSLQGGLKVTCS